MWIGFCRFSESLSFETECVGKGLYVRFEQIDDRACILGESITWDPGSGSFFWVDIQSKRLLKVALDGSQAQDWYFHDRLCSLGICSSGRLVLALTRQVLFFEPQTGKTTLLSKIELGPDYIRLNDGRVGPDGAFWVGSMDERPNREPIGALYRVTPKGEVEVKVTDIRVSNGLAWSPDGRKMFHSDTRSAWIDRWDFDVETGGISNRVRIRDGIADGDGRPDGGACDIEGNYWSAGISGSLINRYDQDGRLLLSVPVPLAAPTALCFGGDNLDVLCLTSTVEKQSDMKLSEHPLTGTLVACRSPVLGSPACLFSDI